MKIVSALLGIALVIVAGAAIHFQREAESGRRQVMALQAQLQQQGASAVAPAPASAAPTPAPIAATSPATADAPAAAPVAAAAAPATTAAISSLIETMRANQSSPEVVARRKQTTRLLMASSNPDVGEALGLSPEEEQKFLDLLAAHQEGMSDLFGIGADNAPLTAQDRAATLRERQQANEAELRAMLGSRYSQWQDYTQARTAWQHRRDLRAVFDSAGTPMTPAQDKALIAALSAEQGRITQETRDAAAQGRTGADVLLQRYSPENRQRMLDAAAAHLTAQQLEGYRGMLERTAAQQQALVAPIRAASEAAARAAAAQP